MLLTPLEFFRLFALQEGRMLLIPLDVSRLFGTYLFLRRS